MDVRLLFPSLYLAAHDLQGKDATLTIRRWVVETLRTKGGDEEKPVLYFDETLKKAEKAGDPDKEKRLVLNKTNALSIARALKEYEMDNWPGRKVTIYPTKDRAFGELVDCIRVRENGAK